MPWEAQNGPAIDYALRGVVSEFGKDEQVLTKLAEHIGTKAGAVKQRLETLAAASPDEEERKGQE